jgi:hypothetical protein
MSSFSERKADDLARKQAPAFIKCVRCYAGRVWANAWYVCSYNKKQLARIYPMGIRIDSSNYEPVRSWYTHTERERERENGARTDAVSNAGWPAARSSPSTSRPRTLRCGTPLSFPLHLCLPCICSRSDHHFAGPMSVCSVTTAVAAICSSRPPCVTLPWPRSIRLRPRR